MKAKSQAKLRQGLLASLLSLGLIATAGAANKAIDLKTAGNQNSGWQVVFLLEAPPHYGLELKPETLVLTLYDTQKSNLVTQKANALIPGLKMEPGSNPADLQLSFKLPGELGNIKTSWTSSQKVFYLEIKSDQSNATKNKKIKETTTLQKIRFGIQDNYTRMVLDLDQRPLWDMHYSKDKKITLALHAALWPQAPKKFGPFRRLKEVALQDLKQKVDLNIQLEEDLPQVDLAWDGIAKKLVMDFNDQPFEIKPKELNFTSISSSAEEPAAEVVQKENKTQEVAVVAPKKSDSPPLGGSGVTAVLNPSGTSLTVSAIKPSLPEPDKKEADVNSQTSLKEEGAASQSRKELFPKQEATYADLQVKSQVETTLPSVFKRKELLKNLSGNEAFLFGRIQEAWETKDYERGAAMINSFIEIFPQSSLNEPLAFLQGDLLLALMKSGRKEILPQVVRTYQDASTRFENSSEVPFALLKVAQAYAFNADYYNALGNINILITNYPKGEHVPPTYITRGKIYLQLKQPDKAIADFKYILGHFPKSAFANEARYGIAEYFHSEAVYDEAERRLKEIEESDPYFYFQYPEYLFLHAKNLVYLGEYDSARNYFFKGLNLGQQPETNDLLLAHIGDTYFQEQKNLEAEKFYKLTLENYPKSEGATIAKIRLASFGSGVSGFQEVVEENVPKPIQNIAMLKMAHKQYEEHHYDAALQTLEKLIAQFATSTGIKKETTELYHSVMEGEIARLFQAQQYEDLIRLYEAGHTELMAGLDPNVYMAVVQSFMEIGKYHQAELTLLKIKTTDLTAELRGKYVLKLAESYFKEGELRKSEDLLKKSLAEHYAPADQQRITLILAQIYHKKGDLKQAYQLAQTIVNDERLLRDDEIARAYLFMGQISVQEGKYEKSREVLNRCIALAEKDKKNKEILYTALVKMADSYHYEGNHAQALKYYQESYDQGFDRQAEGFMEVRFRQAVSLIETGDTKEAQNILSEIADEGDFAMQQRAQMKLGTLELTKQLKQLHLKEGAGGGTI
jgi:tetratricopeptide (TPR) repeat protein